MNNNRFIKKCSSCGAPLEIDPQQDIIECSYCNTRHTKEELLNESERIRLEKMRLETQKEIEKMRLEHQSYREDRVEEEEPTLLSKIFHRFQSVFFILMMLISIILLGVAISEGYMSAVSIAITMTALFLIAFLCHSLFRTKRLSVIKRAAAIIGCVLIVVFFYAFGKETVQVAETDYNWNGVVLRNELPEPTFNKGRIQTNTDKAYSAEYSETTATEYATYKQAVKDAGYTVDAKDTDSRYRAFNDDGYYVELLYSGYSKTTNVRLNRPVVFTKMAWPSYGPATEVPEPDSEQRYIEQNTTFSMSAVIQTDKAGFENYIQQLENHGFTENVFFGDDTFWGEKSNGASVNVEYKGFNQMHMTVRPNN